MSSPKILSTSALAHSASSLQVKHDKLLGIKDIKHWSALDAALETQNNNRSGADFFAMHHSEPNNTPPVQGVSLLDYDDDSSAGDVDYITDEFENRELLPRLYGTPLVVPKSDSSPQMPRIFIDLSATNAQTVHLPKATRKLPTVQLDEGSSSMDDLVIFANGKTKKECTGSMIRSRSLKGLPKQPAVVHKGLPSTNSYPDLSPISFKLLCANEMPKKVARVPLSGSPMQHPFRLANKKSSPTGNVEAAVQIFKVDVSPPRMSLFYNSKTFNINRAQAKGERNNTTTTPAAPVTTLQSENFELPPVGDFRAHEYWGQTKLFEEASRYVTQPPRDYGLIIHLALNRPK
jgi:hypothetical protein